MDDQRRGGAEGADVSADIDDVCGSQEHDEKAKRAQAVMVLDVARQSLAGDVADPAAGLLDGGHQRQHPQGGPQLAIPELGAGLRIGRDAGRVVVRGPGHQSRPQDPEQMAHRVLTRPAGCGWPLPGTRRSGRRAV